MDRFGLNIAIVDDMQTEMDSLSAVLQDYAAINQLEFTLHCFRCSEELLADYHPFVYAVIFMDIYMEGMTGMDATESIRAMDSDTLIVFLTASEEHMPDAFRFHAYDYIQKPADRGRLFALMDDILKRHTILSNSPKLIFSSNRKEYRIPYQDIVCVCTKGNYLEIRDQSGNTYKTRMTFSSIKDKLKEDHHFLQLLRGVLVNMDYIVDFEEGTCHLAENISLPINVRNARMIEQIWQNYVFSKIRREQRRKLGRAERRNEFSDTP